MAYSIPDGQSTPKSLDGYQSGEFFGGSLATTDVNGDGLYDLIIGAPHFTDYEDVDLEYEVGKFQFVNKIGHYYYYYYLFLLFGF